MERKRKEMYQKESKQEKMDQNGNKEIKMEQMRANGKERKRKM